MGVSKTERETERGETGRGEEEGEEEGRESCYNFPLV